MSMPKFAVMAAIRKVGLIPVLRAPSQELALDAVNAMREGGCQIVELTMTVPQAIPLLGELRRRFPDLLVGAGTVLDPETARVCMLEGAQFVVSPVTNTEMIAMCRRYSIPVFPGALTPTEVVAAWQAGADAIKVFPASAMGGAPYLRSLKAPLPQVELIPTGGVTLGNAAHFLEAGALALGVGKELVDTDAIRAGRYADVVETTRQFLRVVQQWQELHAESGNLEMDEPK